VLDRSDTVCDNGVKIVKFISVFLRFSRLHEYGDALTEAEEESVVGRTLGLGLGQGKGKMGLRNRCA
jgi:hypothetical protein